MELQHIKGNTYVINSDSTVTDAPVGIYLFPDKSCLLLDSGSNDTRAREVINIINKQQWNIRGIFNTHAHADHCGGNAYIQSDSGCRIFASEIEAAFINNPILGPYALCSAYPFRLLKSKFLMPEPSRVTDTMIEGAWMFNGHPFDIIDLRGHSLGHMGLRTPDGVSFMGDSLISLEIMQSNPFLYIADVEKQLITLETMKNSNFECMYLSHGGLASDISELVNANYELLLDIIESIRDIINKPVTREYLLHELIDRRGLQVNRNHYYRLWASVSAVLSYLSDSKQARFFVEDDYLKICDK